MPAWYPGSSRAPTHSINIAQSVRKRTDWGHSCPYTARPCWLAASRSVAHWSTGADPLGEAAISIATLRTARSNRLLAALPRATLERIVPFLHLRPFALRQVLQKRGAVLDGVVFPIAGVASMITVSDSGTSVEVATIGSEGMVGLPLFLGGQSSAAEVFVQVAGQGLFMAGAQFHRHVAAESSLTRMLLLYTQALMTQIAQCAACASTHRITARSARWILQTHDRIAGKEFVLTHEFLGLMLGVRRATVSEAAQDLQARGLIRYRRGLITVVDRGGLEKVACDCYRLINREYARLLKPKRAS